MSTLHSSKIIIAFDGNVYSGKTTFLKQLAKENIINHIPEHSDMLPRVSSYKSFGNAFMDTHYKFMLTEEPRRNLIKKGINVLDRSFVSLSAFVYAMYHCGIADIREQHLKTFKDMADKNQIVIPSYYVHFVEDYEVIKDRFNHKKNRTTPDFLIRKDFLKYNDLFYEKWTSKFGGVLCRSSDINNKLLLKSIISKKIIDTKISTIINYTEYLVK